MKNLRSVLPRFQYRSADAGSVVENEICPFFRADVDGDINPQAEEVEERTWVNPLDLAESVTKTPFAFSPWMGMQLPLLFEANAFHAAAGETPKELL